MLFGRSVAHPTDTFIRNVALLSLLLLGGILLYNRVTIKSNKSKPAEKTEVTCWTPTHFHQTAIDFTNHHCRETHKKYKPPFDGDFIPRMNETRMTVDLPAGVSPWKENSNSLLDLATASLLEVFLTAQAVVVMVAYLLLRNVACRAGTQARILAAGLGGSSWQQAAARDLKRSFCTTATYIIIQVCYFIAMVVFVARLRAFPLFMWSMSQPTESKSAHFLCDMQIRRLGNVQHYTVQCIGTTPAVGPELQTGLPQVVLYLDTVLCGAVALMVLLHLLQTLLISPASSDIMAAYDVSKSPDILAKILFGFTDMNLAAIFMNLIGHPQVFVVGQRSIDGDETFKQPLGNIGAV